MKLIYLRPSSWESNSFLLIENGSAILIDAGAPLHKIKDCLSREGATLKKILLTHGHFDHILSIDSLRDEYDAPVYLHEADAAMLTDGNLNAYSYFFREARAWRPADVLLHDGDSIPFEDHTLTVLSTPGHTKGSVCYLTEELLFSGDTVFSDGCGRTDLFGGDPEELDCSLERLFTLPQSLTVHPGHGVSAAMEHVKYNLGY